MFANHYVIGVSVGVAATPTSIAVIEQQTRHRDNVSPEVTGLRLRHLERRPLSDSYSSIARRLKDMQDGLRALEQCERSEIVANITATGSRVVDFFKKEALDPVQVYITGGVGVKEEEPNQWRLSRLDLIGNMSVLLQDEKRFGYADKLELVPEFKKALAAARVKKPVNKDDDFEAVSESGGDDLVLAVGVAVWRAEGHIQTTKRAADELFKKLEEFNRKMAGCLA